MCFVYNKSEYQLPETLSKLYEQFVLLCIRSNIPEKEKKFDTIQNVPENFRPVFIKLCKVAFDTLELGKLEFFDRELQVTQEDLVHLGLQNKDQFDGFGLLHIHHVTDKFGDREKCYSFIHRAVQELLAAIAILGSDSVEDTIANYFDEESLLINVVPFLFGLMHKELLRPLASTLIQIYTKSERKKKLLATVLHCLFESQDETLCHKFGQVFNKDKKLSLQLTSYLDYCHTFYFLSVCKCSQLSIDLLSLCVLTDMDAEAMVKYLGNTSTDVASLALTVQLSQDGIKLLSTVLSNQYNLLSLKLYSFTLHSKGCVKVLCDYISQHCTHITELWFPYVDLSNEDLKSVGYLITKSKFLEDIKLHGCIPMAEDPLIYLASLCKILCSSRSLKRCSLVRLDLFQDDCDNCTNQNSILKDLYALQITNGNWLDSLASSTTIQLFSEPSKPNYIMGRYFKEHIISNQIQGTIDLSSFPSLSNKYILWPSAQLICIFTNLADTTLKTLDISGCYIDRTAGDAVCTMLSLNTPLEILLLNPVHLEEPEAVTMIKTCNTNNETLELLSLIKWPNDKFLFAVSQEVSHALTLVQISRQDNRKPMLNIVWLVYHM